VTPIRLDLAVSGLWQRRVRTPTTTLDCRSSLCVATVSDLFAAFKIQRPFELARPEGEYSARPCGNSIYIYFCPTTKLDLKFPGRIADAAFRTGKGVIKKATRQARFAFIRTLVSRIMMTRFRLQVSTCKLIPVLTRCIVCRGYEESRAPRIGPDLSAGGRLA
jgi:hypothetical protein